MADCEDYGSDEYNVPAMNTMRKSDYAALPKNIENAAKNCGEFAKFCYDAGEDANKGMNAIYDFRTKFDTLARALLAEMDALEAAKASGKEPPDKIAGRERTVAAMIKKYQDLQGKTLSAVSALDIEGIKYAATSGEAYTAVARKIGA